MGYRPPSCAGPTYFPVYQGYVDGFVIANNPAMCALAQVMGAEARAESAEQEDIVLLSVGTGLNLRYLPQEDADWGLRQWVFQIHSLQRRWYAVPLIYMMWEGSVELVNYQCRQLLGDRFHRLDALLPKLVDIDGVDQMDLLCEVAKQTDLQPACQWLDTHFMRDLGGKEKERHPVSADPWACGVCVLYGASAQSLDVLDQEGDGVTVTISRADLARRTREAIEQARRGQEAWNVIMAAYLDGEISLGRAAALLGIEPLDLRARLHRLEFPDRQGRINALRIHAEYVARKSANGVPRWGRGLSLVSSAVFHAGVEALAGSLAQPRPKPRLRTAGGIPP